MQDCGGFQKWGVLPIFEYRYLGINQGQVDDSLIERCLDGLQSKATDVQGHATSFNVIILIKNYINMFELIIF